jgi:RNA polymerase sigma-70 factor, ECF subfamily
MSTNKRTFTAHQRHRQVSVARVTLSEPRLRHPAPAITVRLEAGGASAQFSNQLPANHQGTGGADATTTPGNGNSNQPSATANGPDDSEGEDQHWATAMVQEHGRSMLAYATHLTGDRYAAEDVVQETLIRAWRHRHDLDEDRGSVRGWLLTVIRNIIIDRARARAARPPEVAEPPALPTLLVDHADRTVNSIVVLEALDRLSQEHRSVLIELYANDRTVIQTAETLGIPVGTVKSRTYYALRQLRRQLKPDLDRRPTLQTVPFSVG